LTFVRILSQNRTGRKGKVGAGTIYNGSRNDFWLIFHFSINGIQKYRFADKHLIMKLIIIFKYYGLIVIFTLTGISAQ